MLLAWVRMRVGIGLTVLLGLAGCIDHPETPAVPGGSDQFPPATKTPQVPSTTPAKPGGDKPQQGPGKDPKSVLTEVTYVLMNDYEGGHWMCTGTLVAKDRVITAAHCLDEGRFTNWQIVAPLAKDKPRVSASSPTSFSEDYGDIANPDIGFLKLDDPIDLPAYATLTDVSARVEKGEKLEAVAIVRTAEEFEAPFKAVTGLSVSSTTKLGYDHGIGAPIFSHGGDSGAGLFLVENGQPTHKLIGVARQPDPDAKLDHFTRVDADFLDWFKASSGQE